MLYCDEHNLRHDHFLAWPADERSKALAFMLEKGERCGLCGTAPWEWEENRRAYYPVEHFCAGCYNKSSLEQEAGETPGTTVRLVSTSSQEHAAKMIRQRREAQLGRRDTGRLGTPHS